MTYRLRTTGREGESICLQLLGMRIIVHGEIHELTLQIQCLLLVVDKGSLRRSPDVDFYFSELTLIGSDIFLYHLHFTVVFSLLLARTAHCQLLAGKVKFH